MQQETAYLCGKCGSPAVDFSPLVGGTAKCKSCGWEGPKSELVAASFQHDFDSQHQMLNILFKDLSHSLAEAAQPFGRVLIKWGFLDTTKGRTREELILYIKYGAKALMQSIIETRELIATGKASETPEKEASSGTGQS